MMSNTELLNKPKYSIIIVNSNGLRQTIACVNSILKNTKDFELIIVDNFSDDGSRGYLNELTSQHAGIVKTIYTNRRYTFSENNNFGLKLAVGDYIIFLNNDTVVSPDWAVRMEQHFSNIPLTHIGAVGPVSSSSNGRQMVGIQNPEEWYAEHRGKWAHTGVLYGWCMMFRREVIDQIGGFDERFENSHEDNDLCLRAQLAGYKLIIAYDVYIYHEGQATLKKDLSKEQYLQKGYENRERYYDKWYSADKPKKLVAVYRTNGGEHLEKSLEQTSKFADHIILHFCRARGNVSNERLGDLMARFPKIVKYDFYDGIFQEDYERNWLLQEALKLHASGEADWCISIDDDEIYEDKLISRVQAMMNPYNPEIFAYWCQWRTIWRQELGQEFYRADSTFGRFSNYRFFRLMPNQEIKSFNHPEGHHCGSAPAMANENLRWSNIRVKHLGYDTPEQRQRKFDFYQANDNFKRKEDIGYDDYSHLISRNPQLEVYDAENSISCVMMVKNEEDHILGCLENVQDLVDEYVIVDTGSTDKTIEIIEKFSRTCAVPVKLLHLPWCDNYSIPRNFGKANAEGKWILCMDADERFKPEDLKAIFHLTETDNDFYLFHVMNYLEEPVTTTPKYASTEAVRLFRNIPELFYTGIIHETLDDALVSLSQRRKVLGGRAPVLLHHYGYLKKQKRVRQKLDAYETLNNHQIEVTEGKDPRPYFNLALHYINDGKDGDALKAFHKALEIDPRFWHASQQMAALNMKSAKGFLRNTVATIPASHPFRQEAVKILEFLDQHTFGTVKVA